MSDAVEALKAQGYPAEVLGFVEGLPVEQGEALAKAVLAAATLKDERAERSMNNAVNVVPGPFRRPVKKMLFG